MGLSKMLDDDAFRFVRIEAGKERVLAFSWKRAAEETVDFYEQIIGRFSK